MAKMTDRLSSLRNSTRIFHRDEEGSFVIFSLFILVIMVMIGGLAIDVMRYENLRTTMQNSVDRAVLAAADLDQSVDAKAVVADYLDKAGMGKLPYEVDVFESTVGSVVTGRRVTVNASADLGTYFMKMMGTPTITAPANSTAEEAVNEIEISMILDVSGSMGWGTKLANMQSAAKTFVTEVMDGTEPGQISINVVPYSTQVNAGATLLNQFVHTNDHNYSHCVDFDAGDFNSTALTSSLLNPLQQAGHFDPWSGYWRGTFETMAVNGDTPSWVCRTESDFEITPWASNELTIHNQIDGFTARGNTSIDVAVKWGSALLDPSTRPVFTALRGTEVSSDFVGDRPYDYNNPSALKFMVVMTDGINTTQYMLNDAYRAGPSGVVYDPETGIYSRQDEEVDDTDGDGDFNEPWWIARNYGGTLGRDWDVDFMDDDDPENAYVLSWPELWNSMSMSHRAYSHYYERYWNADHYHDNYWRGANAPREGVNAGEKDTRLNNICTAAKNNGVIIFTIGFEVTDASAIVMQNCASTANHFYRVEGLEIEYAFESIANQINQLKLTQ